MHRSKSILFWCADQLVDLWRHLFNLGMLRFSLSAGRVVGIVIVIVVLFFSGICLDVFLNDSELLKWLRTSGQGTALEQAGSYEVESGSTTIRNLGLAAVALVALVVAVWRGQVAEAQNDVARQDLSVARQDLLNERYQKGAEMLGSNVLSVRIGGIHALEQLAKESPELYHVNVMRVLCAFVRQPPSNSRTESTSEDNLGRNDQFHRMRADVEAVMHAISNRSLKGISLERNAIPKVLYLPDANLSHLDVYHANLSGARLTNVNLSAAILRRANLSGARLRKADLTGANLLRADLREATLWGTKLSGATLRHANISGADFCGVNAVSPEHKVPVIGLTQEQLDGAFADSANPPKLNGVIDSETGRLLEWRGRGAPTIED